MEHFGWPQWVVIGLTAWGVLRDAYLDGKPRTGKHELPISVLGAVLMIWLLWMGGFFSAR